MNKIRMIGFRLLKEDFEWAVAEAGSLEKVSEWAKGIVLKHLRPPADGAGTSAVSGVSKLDKPSELRAATEGLFSQAIKDAVPAFEEAKRQSAEVNRQYDAVFNPSPRSWRDLSEADRVEKAREWMVKVPMPAGFKSWEAEAKVAWLDLNWPLEPKEEAW